MSMKRERSPIENRIRVTSDPVGDSRTQQHFADQCDINKILHKFRGSGLLTHTNMREPVYADVSGYQGLQEALNIVAEAQNEFSKVPAKIRKMFNNDPAEFVDFCSDPANVDKLVELGLANVKTPETIVPVPALAPDSTIEAKPK